MYLYGNLKAETILSLSDSPGRAAGRSRVAMPSAQPGTNGLPRLWRRAEQLIKGITRVRPRLPPAIGGIADEGELRLARLVGCVRSRPCPKVGAALS